MQELRKDADTVLSGLRLMNRPRDNAKERFIESFIASKSIDRFPFIEADAVEDSKVLWADEEALPSMRDVLAKEIEASFVQAGAEAPATSKVIATKILSSDTDANLGIVADLPQPDVSVDLVLAHVVALGYRWPPRIALSVARRATIVLLNRSKFRGRTVG